MAEDNRAARGCGRPKRATVRRHRLAFLASIALLLTSWPAFAQTDDGGRSEPAAAFVAVDALRQESLATRRMLLTSVLVEGVVSAVGGGLLMITDGEDQAFRYAGINTAAFGVANVIIGAVALAGIAAEENFSLGVRANETEQQRNARFLRHALADERRESVGHAINLGLDVGYAAIGGTALLASQLGVDHSDRWLASGIAIAVQAAFLMVVDLWGMEASGAAHRRLLEQVLVAP